MSLALTFAPGKGIVLTDDRPDSSIVDPDFHLGDRGVRGHWLKTRVYIKQAHAPRDGALA